MRRLGAPTRLARLCGCQWPRARFASDADALFFFGTEMCAAADEQKNTSTKPVFCFIEAEADKLRNALDNLLKRNDFVFLKGSRSLELEQFEPILQKERV